MPFSRYQIRNEFSLADPELYKAVDKDDPEALLEGVAMAGLVGVLRQLGDLAEFAAEIFHGLHEEVMVTAARGHGLLVRVQQVESDFPSIERAFLSQTCHSAFFSSSGINWHPNLQVEQNLITKGDLPRFVMDSYEECRGPPRLFLLDKFDVGGAGACLKRYTDPSFYKLEASSYDMMSAEALRDKKIRKTKKKGPQWKNGETPEVFQASHVKLHQLLLEERVQNGASEPARRVKLKKREIKFPLDTESGKGYMEKLLNSPPEDKLVHEVPNNSSVGPRLETLEEVRIVNSPMQNGSQTESPIVDKTVSMEHIDNMLENIPETHNLELPISSIEDKHISVDNIENGYQSDDVASETENYMDALATMESEVETDPTIKKETYSDSQSVSDDESNFIKKKITSSSYSDNSSTSADNMSPRGMNSPQAFASTEIPFRPRVPFNRASDKSAVNAALLVDQETIFKGSTSNELELSEMSLKNSVEFNSPKRTEEIEIDPKDVISSTSKHGDAHSPTVDDPSSSSFVGNPQCESDNVDQNSNSTLVISNLEEQRFVPSLDELDICDGDVKPREAEEHFTDDDFESKSDPAEARVSCSSHEDETEFKDRETVSVDSEIKVAIAADDVRNGDNKLFTLEDEIELQKKELESVNSETKDVTAAVYATDDVDIKESKTLSTSEDTELESETEVITFTNEKDEVNVFSKTEERGENELVINESGVVQYSNESVENKEFSEQSDISPELDSIPSAYHDHSNIQFLDTIQNSFSVNENEIDIDNPSVKKESIESSEKKESSEQSVISSELDLQVLDSIPTSSQPTYGDVNENDVNNPSSDLKILQDEIETLFVIEKTDQNELHSNVSPVVDFQPIDQSDVEKTGMQLDNVTSVSSESESLNQVENFDKLEDTSSMLTNFVSIEEKADQPHIPSLQMETLDSHNLVDHETHADQHHLSTLQCLVPVSQEPSVSDLSHFNMLPHLAPINLEEMPPLPPLPPMQWRMGKLQNSSLLSRPNGGQHGVNHFPPAFSQIESHPSLDLNENATKEKSEHDYEDVLLTESSLNTDEVRFSEKNVPQPLFDREQSKNASTSGREIILPSSTSLFPPVNDEIPNGIRPMKIQRPRTPLIDAVAAHDKSKLRKVSERAMPPIQKEEERGNLQLRKVSERMPSIPKEEERDTLLEQIRAKSVNLKPAVQTRPSIQGPSTNLRVAAILEKANAIRQAFAGSDDDEDDNDSWSDS